MEIKLDTDELPDLEWGGATCTTRVGFDNTQSRLNSVADLAWQEGLGVWHSELSIALVFSQSPRVKSGLCNLQYKFIYN